MISQNQEAGKNYSAQTYCHQSLSPRVQVVKDFPTSLYGLAVEELFHKPEHQTRFTLIFEGLSREPFRAHRMVEPLSERSRTISRRFQISLKEGWSMELLAWVYNQLRLVSLLQISHQ